MTKKKTAKDGRELLIPEGKPLSKEELKKNTVIEEFSDGQRVTMTVVTPERTFEIRCDEPDKIYRGFSTVGNKGEYELARNLFLRNAGIRVQIESDKGRDYNFIVRCNRPLEELQQRLSEPHKTQQLL